DFVGRQALEAAARRAETDPPRVLVGLGAAGRPGPRARDAGGGAGGAGVRGGPPGGAPPPPRQPAAGADVARRPARPGRAGVWVDIRGTHEPYEVVALPFYKRH